MDCVPSLCVIQVTMVVKDGSLTEMQHSERYMIQI